MNNENNVIIEKMPRKTLLEVILSIASHRQPKIGGKIDLGLFRSDDIPLDRTRLCMTITKPGDKMFTIHSGVPFYKKGTGSVYAVTAYRLRAKNCRYKIVAKAIDDQK